MAHQLHLDRNHGHPWTGKKSWDLLEVRTDNAAELQALIEAAEKKFWKVWIQDSGQKAAVLYKPSGAMANWEDDPSESCYRSQ